MSNADISVVLPNLAPVISQEINQSLWPPGLQALLTKAHFKKSDAELVRLLFNLFSQQPIESSDLPAVDVWGLSQSNIKADPCYLHADRDKLLLFADELALSEQESTLLINEVQSLLTDLGMTLHKQTTDSWYIETEQPIDVRFSALPDVKGKGVDGFLPEGNDRKAWLKLWNEIQMLLYSSEVNQQRITANKLPINSVWFWGQGQFDIKANAFDDVFGLDPLLEQLAYKATCSYQTGKPLHTNFTGLGRTLYLAEELNTEQDIQQQLQQLEQNYFEPLWQSLVKKQVAAVTLYIPELGSYRVEPKPRWKFW